MQDLGISEIKTFIGSKNYAISKRFYSALGFKTEYESEQLSVLELSGCRFFLQNYYEKAWCDNTMLHITVNDAQAWYEKVKNVLDQGDYGLAKVAPPKKQDYGAIVTFVWDPTGVLLHLAQSSGL